MDDSANQNGQSLADQEGSCGSPSSSREKKLDKRNQYTLKQRMDMYAFCVLEMEMNGDKVSIKKQQQAIKKVVLIKMKQQQLQQQSANGVTQNGQIVNGEQHAIAQQQVSSKQPEIQQGDQQQHPQPRTNPHNGPGNVGGSMSRLHDHSYLGAPLNNNLVAQQQPQTPDDISKSLLEMKQELSYENYSDFQRMQPLTTQMLREVQRRFARYYPDTPPPSRTTIKHVFEKCVKHGTVENIRTRRKATKIPQGDEITNLLMQEPQLSLRQMARRLNVSTGTVSRRCKALGLVPDSVTTKHQQLAIAKRQKQMKLIEREQKPNSKAENKSNTINNPPTQSTSRASNSRTKQTNRTG